MKYDAIAEYSDKTHKRVNNIEAPNQQTVVDAILEMDHPKLVARIVVIERTE